MLGSHVLGDWGHRWLSLSEEEHVQYVLDAVIEIHGDVAKEQYTGRYKRVCWDIERHQSGAWAQPNVKQHKLYMPSYFETENNVSCETIPHTLHILECVCIREGCYVANLFFFYFFYFPMSRLYLLESIHRTHTRGVSTYPVTINYCFPLYMYMYMY